MYDMLSSDLVKNGPVFLRGKTSQYIFDVRDGVVTPLLKVRHNKDGVLKNVNHFLRSRFWLEENYIDCKLDLVDCVVY